MPVFLFALLLTQGCQQQVREAAHSHEADINVLRDVEIAEEQAWISKDIEKALGFYANDAILMFPNMPAIVGKDSIRAYMSLLSPTQLSPSNTRSPEWMWLNPVISAIPKAP
jgi:hypothetical protein